jgi:hypothetical protein
MPNTTNSPFKRYLGDGVYADLDSCGLVLTAENGLYATDTIVLEPDVLAALIQYIQDYARTHTPAGIVPRP